MWWFYSPEDDADIDHLKVDTSSLKVSLSYYIGVTKITISSKTKEKLGGKKIGGSIRHRPPPHPPLKDSCFVIWDKFIIMVTYIF